MIKHHFLTIFVDYRYNSKLNKNISYGMNTKSILKFYLTTSCKQFVLLYFFLNSRKPYLILHLSFSLTNFVNSVILFDGLSKKIKSI